MGYIEDRKRELEKYLPPLTRKPDFDLFWEQSLEESRRLPLGLEVKRLEDYPAEKVHVYDISYQGMENTRIHGWYLAPRFWLWTAEDRAGSQQTMPVIRKLILTGLHAEGS